LIVPMYRAQHLVEVAEAPGRKPKAGSAEQSVENLAEDLEPDLILAVVVFAIIHLRATHMAHSRGGFQKQEEEHRAPGLGVFVT